jgi:hypothetical protein
MEFQIDKITARKKPTAINSTQTAMELEMFAIIVHSYQIQVNMIPTMI